MFSVEFAFDDLTRRNSIRLDEWQYFKFFNEEKCSGVVFSNQREDNFSKDIDGSVRYNRHDEPMIMNKHMKYYISNEESSYDDVMKVIMNHLKEYPDKEMRFELKDGSFIRLN